MTSVTLSISFSPEIYFKNIERIVSKNTQCLSEMTIKYIVSPKRNNYIFVTLLQIRSFINFPFKLNLTADQYLLQKFHNVECKHNSE